MYKRFLSSCLAILIFGISISSCQENKSLSVATTKSQPSSIPKSIHPSSDVTSIPTCFQPQEMNLFAFTPDAKKTFIRTGTGIQIFDLMSGQSERFIVAPQNLIATALSQDGQTLAWSLQDNSIQLIRLADQQVLATLVGHPDPVTDLLFSSAGDYLFSASHDGLVRVWDIHGTQLFSLETGSEVLGFGISSDGKELATIPFDGPVSLWDLAANKKLQS